MYNDSTTTTYNIALESILPINASRSLTGCINLMAIPVVKFSRGGYKIRKVFAQESTYPKEIVEF